MFLFQVVDANLNGFLEKKNEKWMKHILHVVDLWRGLNKPASNLMLTNVNIFS